jgi:phosphoglycerate dehydrogenase-like enzyme
MRRHALSISLIALILTAAMTAGAARAEVSIEQLINDAGLTAGPVATRDLKNWRTPRKIVVRDMLGLTERLQAAYPETQFIGVDSSAGAAAQAAGADAIIGYCGNDIVAAADNLVWIQIFSAGSERCLAVDKVGNGNILLTNMQKMSSPVIGEHAVAMMMSLTRGLVPFAKVMQGGEWQRGMAQSAGMTSLSGKTVLVVGLGGIGTAVARRAHGLGTYVIATRNSSRSGPDFVGYVGLSDELLTLAARADVVVNALPLTPKTTNLFDRAFFNAVKPGALFINVGRGGSVVTEELVAALEDGRIAGAGLDVTQPEPLPADHPLWQMDNVIITPHVASTGSERERHGVLVEENVRRFIAGDKLLNVVDPAKGY